MVEADAPAAESKAEQEQQPATEQKEEVVEPAAKRPRTDGDEPPLFAKGDYAKAADGWWAHSGGQWLHNAEEGVYFHLPTGRLVLMNQAGESQAMEESADAKKLLKGKVKWFNKVKGFGFIEPQDKEAAGEKDIFFHRNQVLLDDGKAADESLQLEAGTPVVFALGETEDGRVCALGVQPTTEEEKDDDDDGEDEDDEGEEGKEPAEGDDGEGSEASSVEIDVEESLRSGLHQEKGDGKDELEDYQVDKLKLPINVLGETATCIFYGIFDGHGGPWCAEYISAHLAKNILARLRDRARSVSDEVALKTALLGGFKQTEHNWQQHAKKTGDISGSTACTMTIFGPDEQLRLRLFLANVGDSRAVLCTSSTVEQPPEEEGAAEPVVKTRVITRRLTEDHKPNLPAEKKRIEAAGGAVADVNGVWRAMLPAKKRLTSKIAGLAVSRSFGDKDFKGPDIVSAEPDIIVHEVNWEEDEFVILASDGIWDVVTDRDAVLCVRTQLQNGATEADAAKALVTKAKGKGSKDDCTVIIVRFGWNQKSRAETGADTAPVEEEEGDEAVDEPSAAGDDMLMQEGGEEGEEELLEQDSEVEAPPQTAGASSSSSAPKAASAPAPVQRKPAAKAEEDEEDDIFAAAKQEVEAEKEVLKQWTADIGSGLFEGLTPTREELAAGAADPAPSESVALPGSVGKGAVPDKEEEEKVAPAKEAVDADMDMFG